MRQELVIILAIISMFLCGCGMTKCKIEEINYQGWDGAYKLSNGIIEVVVVPSIGGRIMNYSLLAKENLIYEDPKEYGKLYPHETKRGKWHNYGGYKIWIAPEDISCRKTGWYYSLDNDICQVELLSNSEIKVVGEKELLTGTQCTKQIKIFPNTSRVRIIQTMKNISSESIYWSIWDVTQMKPHCRIFFPLPEKSKFPEKIKYWPSTNPLSKQYQVDKDMMWVDHTGEGGKVGSDSQAGWIGYTNQGMVYVKKFSFYPDMEYPDDGCSVEVYTCKDYVEVEVLSPLKRLKPGEEYSFTEDWYLADASEWADIIDEWGIDKKFITLFK